MIRLVATALILYGGYLSLVEGGGPPAGLGGPLLIVLGFFGVAGIRAAIGMAVALAAGYHADLTSLSAYDSVVLPLVSVVAGLYVYYQLWRAGLVVPGDGMAGGDGGGFDGGGDGGGGD
ncbi:hypothetical protein [Endothiovibrio diazotrophicus]